MKLSVRDLDDNALAWAAAKAMHLENVWVETGPGTSAQSMIFEQETGLPMILVPPRGEKDWRYVKFRPGADGADATGEDHLQQILRAADISILRVDGEAGPWGATWGATQAESSSYAYSDDPKIAFDPKDLIFGSTPAIAAARCLVVADLFRRSLPLHSIEVPDHIVSGDASDADARQAQRQRD